MHGHYLLLVDIVKLISDYGSTLLMTAYSGEGGAPAPTPCIHVWGHAEPILLC